MRNFRKFAAALVFAGLVASGMGRTLEAAGPATKGYCKVLQQAIADATSAGLTDLAAYLQSVFDANFQ